MKTTCKMAERFGQLREFKLKNSDWQIFKARMEQYFIANAITDVITRRALLLNSLDEDAYKLIFNLCVPVRPEEKTYAQLNECFNKHFAPASAGFAARYKFYNASKENDEKVSEWLARVRSLAAFSDFGAELQTALRDKFIMGLRRGPIMDRLFEESPANLSLDRAVQIAIQKESSRHFYDLRPNIAVKQEPADIFHVRGKRCADRTKQSTSSSEVHPSAPLYGGNNRYHSPTSAPGPSTSGGGNSRDEKCKVCGYKNHCARNCRYRECNCFLCGEKGHIPRMCSHKNKRKQGGISRQNFMTDNFDTIFNLNVNNDEPLKLSIQVNNVLINFEIDTGSKLTVISENMYHCYFKNLKLLATDKILFGYTGEKIISMGKIDVNIQYNNIDYKNLELFVVKNGGPPLLGRNWLKVLNLGISNVNHFNDNNNPLSNLNNLEKFDINKILKDYSDVFSNDLGLYTKSKIGIVLKDKDVATKFFKARPIPLALRPKIDDELDRLINLKILVPVDDSAWAAPIVPVIKSDGSIRICGDFKVTINNEIETDKYPLPRIEELFTKLNGGQEFSKLDLTSAYQQIELDPASQELVTINTHRGLFKYTRLPFGITSAPSKFQKIMDVLLSKLPNVVCFLDDILITGKNKNEHLDNLKSVLNTLKESGLKLALHKCEFFKTEINYLGYKIDKNGLHTTKDKIIAITKAPVPKNITELKSFLGLVNFYGKFIPNSATLFNPLYRLLRKNSVWSWSQECNFVFNEIKNVMTSLDFLAHYDPEKPVRLIVDSSAYGLGAVITHIFENGDEKPIAYASRTLNKSEINYSQVEKEGLAIIFGVKKFYQYLYGRKFTLVTDNKPLLTIFGPKKGIPPLSASRLQRWAVTLSSFDYNIEFVKSQNNIADALSRLPVEAGPDSEQVEKIELNYVTNNNYFKIDSNLIEDLTKNDLILKGIYKFIKNGWPNSCQNKNLKPYFNRSSELHIQGGCIMLGYRIVIPTNLRNKILSELHESHLGIVKTKSLARSYIWWPGMDKNIEDIIKSCEACLAHSKSPPKTKLINWPYPDSPWERIHIDYLGPFMNKNFLVITDAYTKWLEVFIVNKTTSSNTIQILRSIFARFGLPKFLVSDNAAQFTSDIFQNFLKKNGIVHRTGAPFHPATNGAAENSVSTVKNAIRKAVEANKSSDLHLILSRFLFDYRTTAHCTTGESPANLMFGRRIRTRYDTWKPTDHIITENNLDVKRFVSDKQKMQRKNYKGNRVISFKIHQTVMVRDYRLINKPKWIKGIIYKKLGKRLYLVKVPELSDVLWKRHPNQIKNLLPFSGNDNFGLPISRNTEYVDINVNEHNENVTDNIIFENNPEPKLSSPEHKELPITPRVSSPRRVKRDTKPPERLNITNFCKKKY